mmetsp:Transcript_93353/g.114353  ORF Transcript_93353/g.114353 Transcript_93353/m.114353 type:complete len:83 (-) Transcript_93353:605-853(-)
MYPAAILPKKLPNADNVTNESETDFDLLSFVAVDPDDSIIWDILLIYDKPTPVIIMAIIYRNQNSIVNNMCGIPICSDTIDT